MKYLTYICCCVMTFLSVHAYATEIEENTALSQDTDQPNDIEKPLVQWVEEETPDDPISLRSIAVIDQDTPKYLLEKVIIRGNKKTLRHVILRYLEIKPGEIFSVDDLRLDEARYRLLATGLFSAVNFALERGQKKGFAILRISVKERNTIVIKDISFGLTRIAPDWDSVTPFGSIGVAEDSFLGTGIRLSGSFAAGKDQLAYKIGFSDHHFLNSKFGLHIEGIFADATEYFGEHFLPGPDEETTFSDYEKLDYRRAGIRLGTGYNLLLDYFFWFDLRFENILVEKPLAPEVPEENVSSSNEEPVSLGYVEPDDSVLTSFIFGVTRDTRNHPLLPSEGAHTQISVELSHPVLGSSYEFSKFTLDHANHFPIGKKGHSIRLGITAGLITGNAPFFDQFFVGDYSSFVPDRTLGLNFSNLHPEVLNTSIRDMWYEDLVASINVDYSIPFYRGSGFVYGIDGFVGTGVFALTSSEQIGNGEFPIDITADFGVKMDTKVGIFVLSFANVLQLIPPIRKETTK